MADFGLTVRVTAETNDGTPIQGAVVSGSIVAVSTDADGNAVIETVLITVQAPGYVPYVAQPYQRPSLQAPVTVSLRRLPNPTAPHA